MRKYDAIILGGGIIGCALAEELGRHGLRVAIVERRQLGSEASTAAPGILAAQMDLSRPGPFFELCQASRRMYPRWVTHLEQRTGISVGYHVDGILYLAQTGREEHAMDRQLRWQRKSGLRVERWSPKEIRRHEPAIDGRVKRGYHFPTEAQVDTGVLMCVLAIAVRKADVEIREQTPVRRVLIKGGAVQGVETDQGSLDARLVINCLGSWAALDGVFPGRPPVEPVRGQILTFLGPKRLVRHAVFAERTYIVQHRDGVVLAGSTLERAGFEKALTFDGIHGILSRLRRLSGALDRCTFREAWSGLRPCTPDKLPILGKTDVDGLYVATGHFRHGILLAPITAHLLVELILRGRASLDLHPFSPSRFN